MYGTKIFCHTLDFAGYSCTKGCIVIQGIMRLVLSHQVQIMLQNHFASNEGRILSSFKGHTNALLDHKVQENFIHYFPGKEWSHKYGIFLCKVGFRKKHCSWSTPCLMKQNMSLERHSTWSFLLESFKNWHMNHESDNLCTHSQECTVWRQQVL